MSFRTLSPFSAGVDFVFRCSFVAPVLTQQWLQELSGMRARISAIRENLSEALSTRNIPVKGILTDSGMFSLLPLSAASIATLRRENGIYMPGDGRINVAGIRDSDVDTFAAAIGEVC